MKFKYVISIVVITTIHSSFANPPQGNNPSDPYQRTVYTRAFKQDHIWKKYKRVLEAENLGNLLTTENRSIIEEYAPQEIEPKGCSSCLSGLWRSFKTNILRMNNTYQPLASDEPQVDSLDGVPFEKLAIDFNKELVNLFLESKKSDAYQSIRDELYGTGSYCLITGGLLGAASVVMPPAAIGMGTGFGTFVIANQTASAVYTSVKEYIKLNNYFGDPLLHYELQYAIYKRYIPSTLWESIESRFAFARTNPYDQQKHLKFFDIVFNLPRIKKSYLLDPPANDSSGSHIEFSKLKYTYDNLVTTVDELFGQEYEESDEIRLEIKTSFWQHILASINRPYTKRNLFIVGPPGTGKTRLIQEVSKRMGIPLVSVNLGLIKESSDLLGTEEKPGILLETFTTSRYTNPILLTDEASETFNNPSYTAPLKILLEPNEGRFDSPYLKSTAVNIRDSLWVSLGNQAIASSEASATVSRGEKEEQKGAAERNESALGTRFKTVSMPRFKLAFIRQTALEKIPQMLANYVYVTQMSDLTSVDESEMEDIIGHSSTTRDLDNNLPTWCMKVNERRRLQVSGH